MVELEHLIELYNICESMSDDIEKECVKNIFEGGADYEKEVRYATNDYEYSNAFNGFFEGCRDELDLMIDEEEIEKALTLTDLYVEHFGYKLSTNSDEEIKTIYSKIIDCLIVQVIDELDSRGYYLMED